MSYKLIGVVTHDLPKMTCHDGAGLQNATTCQLRDVSSVGVNPDRWVSAYGVDSVSTVRALYQPCRGNCEQSSRIGHRLSHDRSADLDAVLIGVQVHVVANA